MSNAMSRSKSRWKAVLLAAVATSVVTPMVANAQSLTVGVYANPNPFGGNANSGNVYKGDSNVYIDPYDTDTLYVYATVTGTQAPSATYVDGLNYLYYNVNASTGGMAGLGSITAATPSTLFGGGSFNQTSGNTAPSAGAQGGLVSTTAYSSTPSIAVGSNTNIGNIAKPRSAGDFYWSSSTGSGTNVIVSGNSVAFLVETLTYRPNSTAAAAHPSAPGSVNSVSFNVSIPSPAISTYGPYVATNYFVGLGSTPALGTQPSNTATSGYSASTSSITLNNTLAGDANLDGTVNFTDLGTVLQNFNLSVTGGYTAGDFNHDGVVNFTDLGFILQNFNQTVGAAPTEIAAPLAVLDDPQAVALLESDGIIPVAAVPEPASLSLLALVGAGTLARRRRN